MTNTPIELARRVLRECNSFPNNDATPFGLDCKLLAQSVIEITEAPFMIIEHKGELLGCSEKVFDAYNEVCANRQQANQEQREKDAEIAEYYDGNIRYNENYELVDAVSDAIAKAIRESK